MPGKKKGERSDLETARQVVQDSLYKMEGKSVWQDFQFTSWTFDVRSLLDSPKTRRSVLTAVSELIQRAEGSLRKVYGVDDDIPADLIAPDGADYAACMAYARILDRAVYGYAPTSSIEPVPFTPKPDASRIRNGHPAIVFVFENLSYVTVANGVQSAAEIGYRRIAIAVVLDYEQEPGPEARNTLLQHDPHQTSPLVQLSDLGVNRIGGQAKM